MSVFVVDRYEMLVGVWCSNERYVDKGKVAKGVCCLKLFIVVVCRSHLGHLNQSIRTYT